MTVSSRRMYDAVTVANIPATATMVAGYVDGKYANLTAMRKRFPNAVIVGIAVRASTNDGDVLDIETGDATPAQGPGWVKMRRAAGKDPSVYCNSSTWPAVRAAFKAAKVAEPHYWIAHYDGDPTIPAGAMAKQFHNDGGWDLSSVVSHWPGVDDGKTTTPVKPPPSAGSSYTVKTGDTFSEIAQAHNLTLQELEAANPQIHNFNLIYPGQVVHLTKVSSGVPAVHTYVVKSGDTLSEIAESHNTTWPHLASLNKLSDPDKIYPGQTLRLS